MQSERGASLVEFAMVMPLLFILMMGVVDLGRLVGAYTGIVSAARESARYGSAVGAAPSGLPRYVDCDGIRAAGQRVAVVDPIEASEIAVEYDFYSPANDDFFVFASCPVGGPGPNPDAIASTHRVKVTVTTDVTIITPIVANFFPGGQVSLTVVEARSIFEESDE